MSMKVYYYNRDTGRRYDLTAVTAKVEISGSVENLFRSANVKIIERQNVKYINGERMRIYADNKIVFDGRIFRTTNDAKDGVTLLCHDNAYYFKQFMANAIYRPVGQVGNEKGVRLSDMVRRLARKANIRTGNIKTTTYEHGDINYAGESMQTILQGLIGLERQRTGRRYYLAMRGTTLDLREYGGIDGITVDNRTVFEASSTTDSTNIYTQIRAYGKFSEDEKGLNGKPVGVTELSSSKYKGPDSTGYQSGFRARLKNCDQWDDAFIKIGNQNGVDPLMLKIITMMESSGNPSLTSTDGNGSLGLTQITPGNVGTYVNPARLFEPEYNLDMACKILKGNDKLGAIKRRPSVPSVKNMAHVWNGWVPSQGEDESPYANTFAIIYAGFGGDPNMRFDMKSNTANPVEDKNTPVLTDPFDVPASNKELLDRFGVIEKIVTLSVDSKEELGVKVKALAEELREEKTTTIECIGHPYGISGRRVQFKDNPVASGLWYIHSDTHIFDASGHVMRLELTKYNETPEPEVPVFPPESEEERPDPTANSNPDGGTGSFIRPAAGTVSQRWGPASGANGYTFHNGVDIANAVGTEVKASDGGIIKKVETSTRGYGNAIRIVHAINQKRWTTVYAHLSKINVKVGQFVKQGDVIGLMGSTGNSTGSHLHFEIHNGEYMYDAHSAGNTVDPLKYFS